MLYLCVFLPQLPLEVCQPASDDPVAIVEQEGSRRYLVACNAACRRLGIGPGMEATTATTIHPALRLVRRAPKREHETFRSLAAWAEQFSSWVTIDGDRLLLWIEIHSGLRYFGGVEEIRQRVDHGLGELGHVGLIGVAPTLEAAALLTAFPDAPLVRQWADILPQLAPLPIATLALSEATLDALGGLGLKTIGNVLALPRDSVARRFDPDLVKYLDRLTGRLPDPRKPFRAPKDYRRRIELLGSVETTEGLLFPLRRMFDELQGYLVARDTAVQEVHIDLGHDGHDPTRLEVRTSRPMRDSTRLFALVRERLERTTLERTVEEIVLRADRFEPLGDTQLELLDSDRRKDQGWEDLLDRLRSRLGETAVRRLGLRDDHRPERAAWCVVDREAKVPPAPDLERPMWLLTPRPIHFVPQVMGRPERIEAGWWDGEDARRDYYIAKAPDGSAVWLFKQAGQGEWFLHGLWA